MSEYDLTANSKSIALEPTETIGISSLHFTGKQTRSAKFTPALLREWAEAVEDAFDGEPAVEIVFTPDKPIVAREITDDDYSESVGVCLAPRLVPDKGHEDTEASE